MTSFLRVGGATGHADVERARTAKWLVWRGLAEAIDDGVSATSAGALIDATYGNDVIRAVRDAGVRFATPVEESGREVFSFEADDWRERLAELRPTWAKALVRYNPEDDASKNEVQRARLRELSDHCRSVGPPLMLELLVPPTASQRGAVVGDRGRFDREVRGGLTVRAIEEFHDAGIEPALWKLEGFETPAAYEAVAPAASGGDRDAGLLILGRGENADAVDRWLRAGAAVDGVVGFAIGRTIWWEPLRAHLDGAPDDEVVAGIAENYRRFVDVFASARTPA
jgi:myo-inositol catabolism protein IolC